MCVCVCVCVRVCVRASHPNGQERQRCSLVRTHTPGTAIRKQEGHHYCGAPWGMRGLSPSSGSPSWGPCTRKMNPQYVWLWKPTGLTFGRVGELLETKTLFLKDLCTISLSPISSAEIKALKAPASYKESHWLILGYKVEWQGFGGNFPRDESVGRWQSFSLSFHLAGLVLVGTICCHSPSI